MAVSDEEFRELDDLCKQMYGALYLFRSISPRLEEILEAAESYMERRRAA